MTDKEILIQVLKKAINNGYNLDQGLLNQEYESIEEMCSYYKNGYLTADTLDGYECYDYSIKDIIFSHEFAKAFWGEKFTEKDKEVYGETCDLYFYRWQLHLTSLVLEKEPLRYLEKFLKVKTS